MSRTTIGQIADRIGCSRMTVSRALRGVGRVKTETRRHILSVAREMGYPGLNRVVFSPAVRRRSADHFMRLLFPAFDKKRMLDSEYSRWFFRGLRARFREYPGEFRVVECRSLSDVVEAWRQERFHGIVLRDYLPSSWVARLRRLGPVAYAAALDWQCGVDCVYNNEHRSAAKVLDYLTGKGHRAIMWMGIVYLHLEHVYPVYALRDRSVVDRMTAGVHGVRYAAWANLATAQIPDHRQSFRIVDRDCEKQSPEDAIRVIADRVLAERVRPSAVVLPSDAVATALIEELRRRGLDVPRDMSVVGYGGTAPARKHDPPLTTVALPLERIGRTIPEVIERRLANPDGAPISMQLEGRLIRGATVADIE